MTNAPAGFVGRHSELRTLGERFSAAATGHPQVVCLEGDAGGGKSTLLSQFLSSLPDAAVLEVGGDEAETLLPYGITDQLQPGRAGGRQPARLRETTAMINKMRRQYPDLVVLPAHDPGAAGRLAQATNLAGEVNG